VSDKFRIRTVCEIVLSGEAEGVRQAISDAIAEANKTYLVKGVPQGKEADAARVVEWSLEKNVLRLVLESGPYVRAPSAALRIRRHLRSVLGEKFKIGVRDLVAKEIMLTFAVDASDVAITKIKSLVTVASVSKSGGSLEVVLVEMGEGDLKRNVPDRAINVVKEILERPAPRQSQLTTTADIVARKVERLPIVKTSKKKPVRFDKDPMRAAIELGWIKEFPGRGQWIYTAPYAMLFVAIRQTLLTELVWKLGFQPFLMPKLIPLEVMMKMPGYLDDIPEGMYYVCPPPRDPEAFKAFKEKLKVTKQLPRPELAKVLKEPDYVLAPAQCEPFWQFYGGETLNASDFPYKFYDASGWTYRWEGGGVEGLVRLQEFQRIELTYLGTPEQVVETRDQVIRECEWIADQVLDMEWRITAAIPFWAREGAVPVDVKDSKNVAAYDLEIYLPYRGPREESDWLEVAGCFVHRTKFVDSFKIRELKGRDVWTGCTGLGLSRWTSAFLATHGFDPDRWPKAVGHAFDRNYRIPRTLKWPPASPISS